MKLTKYEQETIINYNQAEDMAQVYTCDKNLIQRMDENIDKFPDSYCVFRTKDSATYNVPKNYIKVVFPRQLTDMQRQKSALRMKAINAQRGESHV